MLAELGSDQVFGRSITTVSRGAKYVDLTHTIKPNIPVWIGFGGSTFSPRKLGRHRGYAKTGDVFTFEKHGFEATNYVLSTDQLGTQLDPPAHWAPEYPAIDELPATYTIRPLVVISIEEKAKTDFGYALQVDDIKNSKQETERSPRVPSCSFAQAGRRSGLIRSGQEDAFPGVSLDALKFLHLERKIFSWARAFGHGLNTDPRRRKLADAQRLCTSRRRRQPRPSSRNWRLGGDWLSQIRWRPRRLCALYRDRPPDWKFGISVGEVAEAPLPKSDKPLHFDE
jgi:kynurenine formamidase